MNHINEQWNAKYVTVCQAEECHGKSHNQIVFRALDTSRGINDQSLSQTPLFCGFIVVRLAERQGYIKT